jgi:alpha-glucosidase (family GH31 glycosyl hydrolase)
MRLPRLAVLALCLPACLPGAAQAQAAGPSGLSVQVRDGRLTIVSGARTLVRNASIRFGLLEPTRVDVQQSAPDRLTLSLTYAAPADAAGGQAANPNGPGADRPLTATVEVEPVTGGIRLHGDAPWARHIAVVMDDLGDHFFGLVEWLYPDNGRSPDLRGQVVPLDVEGEASRFMENYADVASAFYVSSLGYGSFFDTFMRGRYTFGVNGRTEIYHETGTLDWYLFDGPDGASIDRGYFALIGGPKHLPLWALGPIFWRDQNDGGKAQVLDDVARFAQLRIPLTALWLDRPYSNGTNGWSQMDFSPRFADPGVWIGTVRRDFGIEVMTWIAPQVFDPADPFPGNFRDPRAYFDLSNGAAVAEFDRRLRERQYAFGVRGHKMDRAEEFFPLYQRWEDGTPGEAQRARYVYLYARVTNAMLTGAWGADQFNFARGTYHRAQPYLSAVWGGDSRSTWAGMASNLANGIRVGFMGFPIWGSDAGGYLGVGRISEELYARWLELGSWSGMFEVKIDGAGGSGEDRPPWKYSPRLQAIFRAAAERRMQLLPTLYSLANMSSLHGVLMQPLAYAFPADSATWAIADEFLFGGRFLVAPLLTPDTVRPVYLPAGTWYDYDDAGRTLEGGRRLQVTAPLERIPVFVRAGSIFVTGDVFAGSSRRWRPGFERERRLIVHAYPGGQGDRFDYVDALDGDRVKTIELTGGADRVAVTAPPLALPGEVAIVLPRAPRRVSVGGHAVGARYDAATHTLRVPFRAHAAIQVEAVY